VFVGYSSFNLVWLAESASSFLLSHTVVVVVVVVVILVCLCHELILCLFGSHLLIIRRAVVRNRAAFRMHACVAVVLHSAGIMFRLLRVFLQVEEEVVVVEVVVEAKMEVRTLLFASVLRL